MPNKLIQDLNLKILNLNNEINSLNKTKKNINNDISNSVCECNKKPLLEKLSNINKQINNILKNITNLKEKRNFFYNILSNNNKKALLIGINYIDSPNNRLYGCINDAKNIRNILINRFKFLPKNIKLLTDDSIIKPTKNNIINNIKQFINSTKRNEKLFFFYSGHGVQIFDRNRDEKDRRDECLVSSDLKVIPDDQLFYYFNQLNIHSKLFCLMDLCHSATVGDLQFTYDNLAKPIRNIKKMMRNKNITMISSSKDNQLSYDAYIRNRYQGVLTSTFVKFVKSNIHLKNFVQLMRIYINKLGINQKTIISTSYFLRPGKNTFIF